MRETATKIVLIGAGSTVFTRGLMADLILTGQPWNVALVDVDPEALDTAYSLSRRMVMEKDAPIELTAETNRRLVLGGSDFVVSTIGVGGRRAWEQDVFIPREYGIFQPVGDTIMPGGISRALRQIPATVTIARDIATLAPNARFFNYANPMAAICRAVRKETHIDIVGLCHGVPDAERHVAALFGVAQERCSFTAVGMNHLTFFVQVLVDGQDALPQLHSIVEGSTPERGEELRRALFLETGLYSVLHDRHLAEFFPQFHADGRHPGGRLGVDLFSFEATIRNGDLGYEEMVEQAHGRKPLDLSVFDHQVGEHEQLVEIIRSLPGKSRKRYSVNLPNAGQISNLPRDLPLECPAEVGENTIRAVEVGTVPRFLEVVVTQRLEVIELAVQAALTRDRRTFLEAIIADGSARSVRTAIELSDRLWKANESFLNDIP